MTLKESYDQAAIEAISNEFAIAGEFVEGWEIDSGHINSTYAATYKRPDGKIRRYLLQRINDQVFKDPYAVMRNVEAVTRHITWKMLRVKHNFGGQTLQLYPARGGRTYTEGNNGGIWRCYNFIEGCRTYDVVENTRQAYQASRAFGAFLDLLEDMHMEDIEETIPDFHNTPKRYEAFEAAVAADACGRLKNVEKEVAFVRERKEMCGYLVGLLAEGKLPLRVTHNDTKLNNVMIDDETDEAVCVIDLDTIMPGLLAYDFGDLVRTATSPADEDEKDLSLVEMRMPMFEAIAEGYIDGCDCITEMEVETMVFGGKLMTFEVGMRFLTDYLNGDHYFRTKYEDHNLDRCRTQLRLVECIEAKEEQMNQFVKRVARAHAS